MKTIYTLLCILLYTGSAIAQKHIPNYKDITAEDLKLQSCDFEPDATALKLYDLTETEFITYSYGTKLKTERKVRIKIFNEKGYEHASIRIPYLSKKGWAKIKELNGAVYTLGKDDKVVVQKLDKKDFFKEKAANYVDIINFTFPNLAPGSIIEYSYTTVENNLIHIFPWMIQDEIPVRFTSHIITTPVFSKVYERVFGENNIQQSWELFRSNTLRRTTYFHENIPSFKAEPFMSSVKDHLKKVNYLLIARDFEFSSNLLKSSDTKWKIVGGSLLRSKIYQEQVRKMIPGTERIIDSSKKIIPVKDRIAYIYGAVKKQLQVKTEQTTQFNDLKEAWEEKSGTSTEINFILLNLLTHADIKSAPMLVSTRENGKIDREFPSVGQVNGVDIVAFDSTAFYILDASQKHHAYHTPPLNILNREAFILSEDSMQWVSVTDNRPLFKQSIYTSADIDNDGNMFGTSSLQHYDYAKAYLLDSSEKDSKKTGDYYSKKPVGLKILSATKTEITSDEDPLFETIEFEYALNNSGNFYFINPQNLLTEKTKNPFIAEKRATDIDLGCNQLYVMNMAIRFPDSFSIEHLPQNVTLRAPDSSFYYTINYTAKEKELLVSQFFETKRALFSKEEYTGIQEFYRKMYALMEEEIILKKK